LSHVFKEYQDAWINLEKMNAGHKQVNKRQGYDSYKSNCFIGYLTDHQKKHKVEQHGDNKDKDVSDEMRCGELNAEGFV
jgi:hypothetical protein